MVIHCINLKRAVERRSRITEEWIEQGYDISFFEAFDRRDLERLPPPYPYDEQHAISNIGRPLSPGEIACATSHCQLYEKLLRETKESEFVILEDDVSPVGAPESLDFILTQARRELPNVDVILLHRPHVPFSWHGFTPHFYVLKNPPWGNQFTWFTRDGLEKMVGELSLMRGAADHVWAQFAKDERIALTRKPLGLHLHDETYIGNEFRGIKRTFLE